MDDDSSLDTLLARATNPLCRELDMEAVQQLCERILLERDGSHQALRFLAHKIQSPQEREAMQALLVLEECANRCGAKFQDELGKFRFLNELIKVVSPKYLGNRASQRVKQKIIEVLYRWSIEMKHHAKIQEAYQMLKRQGVIAVDPVYVIEDYEPGPAPAPRSQSAVFEDEEKSQMLQKLLQSKNPEDLQAANRLIRNMVKEADRRMEMLARRATEIETVHNNAKVLKDMLANYRPGETSAEEQDLMKELFESCERLRPKLFRLAGEMEEKDEGLNEILTANDELTNVINIYKKTMGLEPAVNGGSSTTAFNDTHAVSAVPVAAAAAGSLLDLGSPGPDIREEPKKVPADLSLLDDQLLALGIGDPGPPTATSSMADLGSLFSPGLPQSLPQGSANMGAGSAAAGPFGGFGNATTAPSRLPGYSPSHQAVAQPTMLAPSTASGLLSSPLRPTPSYVQQGNHMNNIGSGNSNAATTGGSLLGKSRGMEELDALGQSLIKQALPHNPGSQGDFPTTPQKIPLNQMSRPLLTAASSGNIPASAGVFQSVSVGPKTLPLGPSMLAPMEGHPPVSPSKMATDNLLNDLFVPLEQIQPGSQAPLNLHEENGVRAVIHIARNRPQEHVSVLVVSITSQSSLPVRRIAFQAVVPKTMRIKVQPPTATELPPHNPILPAAAITQVMLIANPAKDKVRLKYKLSYAIEEESHSHSGEVDCPVDTAASATS
ncbi:ADP-ribosylation factor-binding protein GGA2 isoform X2 [Rhipicephalus sanguineus]|uniref:ADP-ribosylation factor-binding protein GGA2 isoform X2 n=1 Tax=Rhipicephalus sanguineus TaxID=34632 RepID=UPI00189470E4|nr:ADP-ribosylation factor-binding protein GGA2 isoform X2 [Rhipicephalus sanguineus]